MGIVVATDVLTGITIGVILTLVRLNHQFLNLEIIVKDSLVKNFVDINLIGATTFIPLPQIIGTLEI